MNPNRYDALVEGILPKLTNGHCDYDMGFFRCREVDRDSLKEALSSGLLVKPGVNGIIKAMKNLKTDEERNSVISGFCRHCGGLDRGCQCWNDE